MEIGITEGAEDGVDNCDVNKEKLSPTPENVYKAGNAKLLPELLEEFQKCASAKVGQENQPCFVFHGGSGFEKHHSETALGAGVLKTNVDTDTQWAYWDGINNFYLAQGLIHSGTN